MMIEVFNKVKNKLDLFTERYPKTVAFTLLLSFSYVCLILAYVVHP